MKELPERVESKVKELNKLYPPAKWEAVEGLFALTGTGLDKDGEPEFYPGKGVQLKAFYNSETGELKTFYAADFMENEYGTVS